MGRLLGRSCTVDAEPYHIINIYASEGKDSTALLHLTLGKPDNSSLGAIPLEPGETCCLCDRPLEPGTPYSYSGDGYNVCFHCAEPMFINAPFEPETKP
jgi:hypothetical protein